MRCFRGSRAVCAAARPFSSTAGLARRPGQPDAFARSSRDRRRIRDKDRDGRYSAFGSVVRSAFGEVTRAIEDQSPTDAKFVAKHGPKAKFWTEAAVFQKMIDKAIDLANRGYVDHTSNPLFWALRHAFVKNDMVGLRDEIHYGLHTYLNRIQFSPELVALQRQIADIRTPFLWFPATRALRRTIHLHVGPTNSGKTYHALKALEAAKSGIYAGPLRLLAHEIYTRLTSKGLPCALVTGEEQRIPDADDYYISCTVEMTPVNKTVDVAVIDEIQMLGDPERGSAWAEALFGVKAKEVHVCGEERTVDLVQSLCRSMGDECVVHRYKRLSPLRAMSESIGKDFSKLRKGDAVVTFSRVAIYGLKTAIERQTGRRCAVVYGSLPPETRAQQAALFNDPTSDYDYLVASDAIGMGLNLAVKRIVFESIAKHDGLQFRDLSVPEVKQIGGRAGRFRTARQDIQHDQPSPDHEDSSQHSEATGLVTSMEEVDLPAIRRALRTQPPQMTKCYIGPPPLLVERFAATFPPNTPFRFILLRLRDLASVSSRFEYGMKRDALEIADVIQDVDLAVSDRLIFLLAPAIRNAGTLPLLREMAQCVSERRCTTIADLQEINLELLDDSSDQSTGTQGGYLQKLENLHQSVSLYLWLSYRFSLVFTSQALAFHVRDLVQARINKHLEGLDVTIDKVDLMRIAKRHKARQARRKQQKLGLASEELDEEPAEAGPGRWNEAGHEEPLVESVDVYETLDKQSDDSHTPGLPVEDGETLVPGIRHQAGG